MRVLYQKKEGPVWVHLYMVEYDNGKVWTVGFPISYTEPERYFYIIEKIKVNREGFTINWDYSLPTIDITATIVLGLL